MRISKKPSKVYAPTPTLRADTSAGKNAGASGDANPARGPQRAKVKLGDLVQNTEQQDVYDDLTNAEFAVLLDDVRLRGLDHPIEVLPAIGRFGRHVYQILDGHQRRKVLELLGVTEVEVLVRHDLADASPSQKQVAFISANLLRRHLDTVGRVRAAVRRYEWQHGGGRRLTATQVQKARDEIGGMIGVSGRTVSRYLRLARTPMAVQRSVSAGLVPLVVGEQVADLRSDQQDAIAGKIAAAAGAKQVREVLREFGLVGDGRHKRVNDAVGCFVRALARGQRDLQGRLGNLAPRAVRVHLQTLEEARETIDLLLAAAAKA